MRLTVAICTWNRANLLEQTLRGLQNVHVPQDVDWEVLVINNNCSDHTNDVIATYAQHLPLRGIHEENQGHSHARNRAVHEATGELILWTDDDVIVSPDWLQQYATAARNFPDHSLFGGVIEPWFEGQPPCWVEPAWRHIETAYAARNLGPEPFDFEENAVPFGANFAVRMDVQYKFLFDTQLGRKKSGMIGGEDVTMIRQALRSGHRGRWLPEARVKHFIPRQRQTLKYIRRYYEGLGTVSQHVPTDKAADNSPMILGRPRWLWRAWVESELAFRLQRITKKSDVWMKHLVRASVLRGQLKQSC